MLPDAHLIGLKHRKLVIVASELVASGHHHKVMALCLCQMLDTPRLAAMDVYILIFLCDRPVCTYNSVVSSLISEHVCNDLLVV